MKVVALKTMTETRLNAQKKSSTYSVEFFQRQKMTSYRSACEVVPIIQQLLTFRSVCDVGCGLGTWLRAFHEHGVKDILGMDGEYVDLSLLQIPSNVFVPTDLSKCVSADRVFDLAISLEVAEHLPEQRAKSFVEDLTKLSPVVLFSAAIPGQGGIDHVNEQWQTYWSAFFLEKDYMLCDALRPKIWPNAKIAVWYRQNAVFYCRRDVMQSYPNLSAADHSFYVPLVHPEMLSFRDSLRAIGASVGRAVRSRMAGKG